MHYCLQIISFVSRSYDNTDDEDDEYDVNMMLRKNESSNITEEELYSTAFSEVIDIDDSLSSNVAEMLDTTLRCQPLNMFFKRSDSMTFLGCEDPQPFTVSNRDQ